MKNPSQSETLLQYLRNELGLYGTKLSCGESGCGSCTVTCTYLDYTQDDNIKNSSPCKTLSTTNHRAINACTTLLVSLHGTAITTIEGLGSVKGVG